MANSSRLSLRFTKKYLIKRWRKITEEQKKIVEDNHNLIYSFLREYKLPIDEWYGLAAIGLCKAAMSYDNNLSKFSVYAYTCMFTAVYSEKRKEKLSKTIPGHQIIYYQTEHDDGDGNTSNLMNLIPSKENVEEEALSEVMFIEFSKKLKK